MIEGRCITCGRGLVEGGSVTFPCPECGTAIKRCRSCREKSAGYECPDCGMTGP
ncbi:MAG TPA: DUF1610 domain-containing protein [Thermoplasmatales archaeon]|nr:DUF1610 domain-containing protein [Thermoplasmatales archaeon]